MKTIIPGEKKKTLHISTNKMQLKISDYKSKKHVRKVHHFITPLKLL